MKMISLKMNEATQGSILGDDNEAKGVKEGDMVSKAWVEHFASCWY